MGSNFSKNAAFWVKIDFEKVKFLQKNAFFYSIWACPGRGQDDAAIFFVQANQPF